MSHDNRFSKTNYLKTNLLKQIKKIFSLYTDLTVLIQLQSTLKDNLLAVRRTIFIRLQNYKKSQFTPNNFAIFCIFKT